MPGISNRVRCPICNKFGSKKNPDNRCKKCTEENLEMPIPKCIIGVCNNDAFEVRPGAFSRHCKDHHFGTYTRPTRGSFNVDWNDQARGARQIADDNFGLVRKDFGVNG